MTLSKKRIMYATVLSAIAASLFSVMLLVGNTQKTEAVESSSLESVAGPVSIMDRFEKGYATDLIAGKIQTDNISVKRGQTLEIPVTFEHLGNTSTSKDVTLTNFHNAFRNFAPSSTEGLDDTES